MRRLLAELRRRHVLSVGAVYLVVAWALIAVSASAFVFALLAVALPIVVVLTWLYDVTPHGIVRTGGSARADAAARRLDDDARALAVLPFSDISLERDQPHLGEGIAAELLNALASVEDLHVVERTSSFALAGNDVDTRAIGRRLEVDLVLEGSVRSAGNRLLVTAQLLGVDDGMSLWSRRFERDMIDVFAVQDEIAADIAAALGVSQPAPVSARIATDRIEAYDAYLRGRYHFHRQTESDMRAARELFENAIALDPAYAPAWAGIADTCAYLYENCEPSEENRRAADQSSLAALEYAPELPEAHGARARALSLFRSVALLLIASFTLGGCMAYVEPETLEPQAEIDAVRLTSGETIRFGGGENARYEPPDVVVRDDAGSELRRFPGTSINAVYDKRIDVVPTIVGVTIGAAIIAAIVANAGDSDPDLSTY